MTQPHIDADRLWASLMEMARIGPGVAGGNNRLAFSPEDDAARALFKEWCRAAGLAVAADRFGNIFVTRPGTEDLPPVLVGSHLDTQPTGGRFDGVLGVLAGLEAIRAMNEAGIRTRHPVVLVNWTNEEGAIIRPMMGSEVFTGALPLERALAMIDHRGLRLGDMLAAMEHGAGDMEIGFPVHAYLELHIEQGPILEDEGIDIGVVTHGQGLWWLQVTLTGKEAHTGSTPMPKRRNAGLGMARITELVHEVAMDYQPDAVGAIGHMEVYPNSRNVIPGRVVFTIDIRSPNEEVLNEMRARIEDGIATICEALDIGFAVEAVGHFAPVTFDEGCVKAIRDAAERLGYSHRDIVSGAGHDACWINRVAPTAMVMCPCVDGLSHNEAEEISKEWAGAGADVLFHAVVETAEIVE